MNAIMTLKKSPILRGGFLAYNSKNELIATIAKKLKSESDYSLGAYRICFTRGRLQGKIANAHDFQDINDKICSVIDFTS